MNEDRRSKGSTLQFSKINVNSPLYCPHDLTKQQEFRDDLPTLLNTTEENQSQTKNDENLTKIKKNKSALSIFNLSEPSQEEVNIYSLRDL